MAYCINFNIIVELILISCIDKKLIEEEMLKLKNL